MEPNKSMSLDEELARNVVTIEELKAIILKFGDATSAVFTQMGKGNWKDDHGHGVHMNKSMHSLYDALEKASAYAKEKGLVS